MQEMNHGRRVSVMDFLQWILIWTDDKISKLYLRFSTYMKYKYRNEHFKYLLPLYNVFLCVCFRKRRGAINSKQLTYLEKYRSKQRLRFKDSHTQKNKCCTMWTHTHTHKKTDAHTSTPCTPQQMLSGIQPHKPCVTDKNTKTPGCH